MIRTKRALLCLVPVLACHHVSDDTAGGGPVAGFPPVLGGFARFQDLDLDGLASPGDQVILPFSGPVTVNTSDVSVLFLPILQDTFGAGATIVDGPAANELTVVLGSGARLRSRGRFVGTTSIGSPSSLAINPKLPPNLIEDPVGGFDAQGGDPIDLWPQHVPGIQSGLKAMADTIEAADLNRDGIGDLITTSYGTGVLLYEGLESGGYTSLLIDPATALRALPVDLFGAGRTDLVVQEDTALTVVRNLSPAGGPIEVTIDASYPLTDNFAALAHWDVDHDGDRDVVCAGELGLWVYENEGGTLLVPTAPLVSSPGGGRDLAVADTNNDGWEDVLVALDGQNVLMRPIPCVGFQLVAQGTGTSTRVELVDLNGDGRIDAVSAGEDVIEVWYGADGGIFEPAYDLPAEFILELEVLDVDGDTVPELLVNDGLLTRVFADAGAGVLEDIGLGLETGASTSIDVFDLDGDGDDDLLVVSGGMPQIWDGSLAGTWGTPRHRESLTDVGAGPVFAAVTGDLDGDGNLDLVFGRDLRLELRMGAGDGTFGAPTLLPLPEGRAHDAALGDVDGDGDLDLVVALLGVGPNLWLNDGLGTLSPSYLEDPSTVHRQTAVAVADLNGDAFPELLLGTVRGFHDLLYVNRGCGCGDGPEGGGGDWHWFGFDVAWEFPDVPMTMDLATSDVDLDGDLDVVCAHAGQESDRIFLNGGDADLTLTLGTIFPMSDTTALTFGDVDRDGDEDLVLAKPQGNRLMLAVGDGTFSDAKAIDGIATSSTELLHLDGDGRLDLLVGNASFQGWQTFRGTEDGLFSDGTWQRSKSDSISTVAVGDLDGDGATEFLTGSRNSGQPNRVWLSR